MGLVGGGLPSVAVDGGVVAGPGTRDGGGTRVREAPLGSGMSEGVQRGGRRGSPLLMMLVPPIAHFDYQFGYRKFDGVEGLAPPST